MIIFTLLGSFCNYLYQLAMGRLLSVEDYGTLVSLLAFSVIFGLFSQTIYVVVTKYTSSQVASQNMAKINYLWRFFLKKTFLLGVVIYTILLFATPLITTFLNISCIWYPIIAFSSLILTFILYTNLGILRGLERYFSLGFTSALWPFLKLVFAIGFVKLSMGLTGGLLALFTSCAATFIVTIWLLRGLSSTGKKSYAITGIRAYFGFAILALFAYTVLTNVDVILVKHYMDPVLSGNYSAISTLGKIVLFIPGGVSIVLFPKVSALSEAGTKHHTVLLTALLLTTFLSGVVVVAYWLFPQFIVDFVYNGKYSIASACLFKYGLAMFFFSISYLLMNYFLSFNQTKIAYPFLSVMILQIVLISILHSSILQVVNVMLLCGVTCLILVSTFYLKTRRLNHSGVLTIKKI